MDHQDTKKGTEKRGCREAVVVSNSCTELKLRIRNL